MRRGAVLICTVLLSVLFGLFGFADDMLERPAISITNDYEFTTENGVTSGQGTSDDPYVIQGWTIDAGYDDYGIRIHGTTRYFVIRDVEVSGAAKAAIYLSYVQNGTIEDCRFVANRAGVTMNFAAFNRVARCLFSDHTDAIRLYFSHHNQVISSRFEDNDTALWFDASNENEAIGNLIQDSHMGLYLNLGSQANRIIGNAFDNNIHNAHTANPNTWDDGASGNYWSGFEVLDTDANGIWDSPYVIRSEGDQDNFPLICHPLVAPGCGE